MRSKLTPMQRKALSRAYTWAISPSARARFTAYRSGGSCCSGGGGSPSFGRGVDGSSSGCSGGGSCRGGLPIELPSKALKPHRWLLAVLGQATFPRNWLFTQIKLRSPGNWPRGRRLAFGNPRGTGSWLSIGDTRGNLWHLWTLSATTERPTSRDGY